MDRRNQHLLNLIIKYVLFVVVFGLVLMTGSGAGAGMGYNLGRIMGLSLILSLTAYGVGDLWILPVYGNWAATAADAVLVVLGLMVLPGIMGAPAIPFMRIIMAALVLGIGEFYFHRYLQTQPGAVLAGEGTSSRGPTAGGSGSASPGQPNLDSDSQAGIPDPGGKGRSEL